MSSPPSANPDAAETGLRSLALSATAESVGIVEIPGGTRVFGVLMETGYERAVVTLFCVADGTTSLYFSTGGGAIGCGQHASVAALAKAFVIVANTFLDQTKAVAEFPLPSVGRVRFYLRAFEGTRTWEALEDDLGNMRDPLSPLFHAGHRVISAIRELGLI